jgi:hypothetical protein
MNILVSFLLSQSIMVPIIMGTIRIKRLGKMYSPFFLLLLLGFLAELASFIFIDAFKMSNAPVIKVYSLLECCIILYQLYQWKNSTKYLQLYISLAGICVLFWIIESIVFININTFSPYFRCFYAFIIILLSINQINAMMFNHEDALFKNPKFILCLSFIVYFLYQIIYEASYFVGSDKSIIANKIIIGFDYINFAVNLLYAVALFFIPANNKNIYNQYFKNQ